MIADALARHDLHDDHHRRIHLGGEALMGRPRVTVRRWAQDYPPPTPQPTPCCLWQGPDDGRGYGMRPDRQRIHRWVWKKVNGPIPEGMDVLHKCDNPPCFRYDHLFLGTPADNAADRGAKGRTRVGVGERNARARLTEADVLAIRAAHLAGESNASLAERFGVPRSNISYIVNRKTWRHLS